MSVSNTAYTIEQGYKYEGEDWWSWWVWIEGDQQALDDIDFVVYTLHPTFYNPVRTINDRSSKFRLETEGWGTFPIHCKVVLKNGGEIALEHELYLEYPDGSKNVE